MTYHGTVKDGVVVLEPGADLPDGTRVTVEPQVSPSTPSDGDALAQLPALAVDAGIDDLAANVDHYLYGHPKRGSGDNGR